MSVVPRLCVIVFIVLAEGVVSVVEYLCVVPDIDVVVKKILSSGVPAE